MNTLEARRRLLGRNVYKRTTEGNPAIAQGSLARMYPGITMQGWTEQNSTTGANLFDIASATIGAVSRTTGENLEYGANWKRSDYIQVVSGQQYSCTYVANYQDTGFAFYDEQKTFLSGIPCTTNFTVPESAVFCRITVHTTDGDPNIFMFNAGSTALPWEPYTGGKPSPSPDYPQEIVSAGTQNQDTGKWEYEITIANAQTDSDQNQSVNLNADRQLTNWDKMQKRKGQWGWVYKSMEITLDGSEEWRVYAAYEGFFVGYILDTPRVRAEGFCESFICETERYNDGKGTALWLGVNNYSVYAIRIPQYNEELPDSGLQDWKDWLSENPITILTYADEETFVPLSESEQEQMNALHTFRPTTVLSNDEGCEMSLTYKTKKSLEVTT